MPKDKSDNVIDDAANEATITPDEVGEEWAGEYAAGAELFVAKLSADDFDPEYDDYGFEDGTTLVLRRCVRKPSPGWIRQHAHLSDMQRTFAMVERYSSERAMAILDSLTPEAWDRVIGDWGADAGFIPGKSRKSARR